MLFTETAVLSAHALRKAEVLFQHCHTRGKPIWICFHVQIFYTHPYQQLITKDILENKQQSKQTQQLTTTWVNRSHSVSISIIPPKQRSTKFDSVKMHLLNDGRVFDSLKYNSQSDIIGRSKTVSTQNQENNFTLEHLYPLLLCKNTCLWYNILQISISPLQQFHHSHVSNPFSFKKSC